MPDRLELWGVNDPNISAQLGLAAQLDLFHSEAGLDVTCTFIESGTTMPSDVLQAEKKPFAFTQTPITALLLHNQGFHAKLVAPLADIAGTQQVIIREQSGITRPADLESRQIGMAQGAAVYIAVKNMAHDCDVNVDRLRFVNLLPHEQLAAFEAGQIDAMACWEPWTTKARTMGGVFYFSGNYSEIPGMEGNINWLVNQSCLIVPEAYLREQPDDVTAIVRVLRKATDLINSDRKEAAKELAGFFGLSRVELIMAMQKNTYAMTMDNLFRIGLLGFRDFLFENGRIASKIEEDALYDSSYLQQVDPALVLLETAADQHFNIIEQDGIYYREDATLPATTDGLRVLLADDSKFMRVTLSRVIKSIGGTIIGEATTGSEAIALFTRLQPSVVTMDLSMPGLSGVDAIQQILAVAPQTNIIVISGANLEELRQQVFDLGVQMFITKPFEADKVTALLTSRIQ